MEKNTNEITVVQQMISSCTGAILTSIFGNYLILSELYF